MVDPERTRVWAARLAAPVAFFLAATILVVIVQRALESGESEAGVTVTTEVGTTSESPPDGTTTEPGGRCRRFYRVRTGDTLESIAARCQTDVTALLDLNPDIDPLTLSPGDRIRVR